MVIKLKIAKCEWQMKENHQGNHVTNDSKLLIASLSTSIDSSNNIWYIDWRPTRHITRNRSYFNSFQQNEDDEFVYLGDDSKHKIHDVGTIGLTLPSGEVKYIPNVLYIPSLTNIYCLS